MDVETEMIAARQATFRKPTRSPFGPEDEIGMLNLITPDSRARVVAEADARTCFDLSVDYFVGMPSWLAGGDPAYQLWLSHTPAGQVADDRAAGREPFELMAYSGDCVSMYTHCGTHIDALNHFGYYGEIWNCFSVAEHLGARHWHRCGVEQQPPIVARGLLIDVAASHGVDILPDSYGIGPDDLRQALDRQGSEVRPGDVVLVRTGRMQVWPDHDAYLLNEPGLNREGAEYLAKAGAIVIGADNIGLDQMPSVDPENWVPVHTYLFTEAGVAIMEVVHLDEIAAEGVYEFAFIGAALRFRGATAAPMRPFAFPLRK